MASKDFDESKIQRDEKGRFSSTGGGGKRPKGSTRTSREAPGRVPLHFLTDKDGLEAKGTIDLKPKKEGTLKEWTRKALGRPEEGWQGREGTNPPGLYKGHSGRVWDAAKDTFGPMAGHMASKRFAEEGLQKELLPKGEQKLQEGVHFGQQSQGDPWGKRIEKSEETTEDHDTKELADQAFRDIASKYPNVAGYLAKHPLAEVQTRKIMAEWVASTADPTRSTPLAHTLPVAGQYTSGAADPQGRRLLQGAYTRLGLGQIPDKFAHAEKPGDLLLSLSEKPTQEATLTPAQVKAGEISKLEKGFVHSKKGEDDFPTFPNVPWSASAAAKTQRGYALTTTLHELGHHVLMGDKPKDQAYRDETKNGEPPTKGERARDLVTEAFEKDRERAIAEHAQPFTGYAGTSPNEWFAEAFALFHVRPDYLKERSPIAYRTVKKILKIRGMQQPDQVRRGSPPLLSWAGSKRRSENEL